MEDRHDSIFAPPWRYVGNITLTGSLSACEALRLPCPTNTTTPAEEFANGTAIIYAEELTVCQQGGACTTSVILVSNSSVYCITPEVPWAAVCPSEIGGT